MPKTRVLIDASSAVILFKSDLLGRLTEMYDVFMARVVFKELTAFPYPGAGAVRRLKERGALEIIDSDKLGKNPVRKEPDLTRLGAGERETIRLYYHDQGDFIIIDDGKGAGVCRDQRIPYINALLFPRILLFKNILSISEFDLHFETIVLHGRYSEKIMEYARTCSVNALRFFLPESPGRPPRHSKKKF